MDKLYVKYVDDDFGWTIESPDGVGLGDAPNLADAVVEAKRLADLIGDGLVKEIIVVMDDVPFGLDV